MLLIKTKRKMKIDSDFKRTIEHKIAEENIEHSLPRPFESAADVLLNLSLDVHVLSCHILKSSERPALVF